MCKLTKHYVLKQKDIDVSVLKNYKGLLSSCKHLTNGSPVKPGVQLHMGL